jgi:serine phosphatase RsbU (regulator of sigma subunit)/pSer/pThr/pTyr-binding forkhead associated (FHA) protein
MPELSVQGADGARRIVPLSGDRVSIGRSRENDLFLPDQWLSRAHAEIQVRDDGCYLVDLGSKNGTLLNGARLEREERLRGGDVITLGEHVVTFVEEEGGALDEAEPVGTQVFSAVELSAVAQRAVADPEGLARQNRVLGILSRAASHLILYQPLGELFETIIGLMLEAVPAERAAILIVEDERPVVKASRSLRGEEIHSISRSIARNVLENRNALLVPNILQDAALKSQDSIMSTGVRSAICAPLWFASPESGGERVIGLVYLDTLQRTQAFSEDDLQALSAIANIAAAKIENVRLLEENLEKRRLEEDMRIAAEIQTSLLPRSAPSIEGWELVGSNRPSRSVGGDYFDFGQKGEDVLLALGDVSGKGTGAALLMTVLRAAVRAHWTDDSVSGAVREINRTVHENVPSGKFVTFFLGRLDPADGHLTYVNAGHNPPLLIRADGSLETLTEGGMVLGMFESVAYDEGSAELARGDTLLIFSDGVTESWSEEGEEYGEERLAELAKRRRDVSAGALQDAILEDLERFESGGPATDDRTLIVLKRA